MQSYNELEKEKFKKRKLLMEINPNLNNESGIYLFYRFENGFKFAYVGQAVDILERLVEHLMGNKQWIDLSIKKHGLYSNEKETGYKIAFKNCDKSQLNKNEMETIKKYANMGFQLRNVTSGSQDKGKFGLFQNKQNRGFYDGVDYGYKKARKEVAKLFDKNLVFGIGGKPNSIKERYFERFKTFIDIDTDIDNDKN